MDLEASDASDREVVEDSCAETKTTSEDDVLEDSAGGESSSTEENEDQRNEPKSSQSTAVNRNSQSLSFGDQSTRTVLSTEFKPSGNSGPDSIDANAAERIKSTTLRRQRKQVDRFVITSHTSTRDKQIVIPDGSGTKLQDIPYIAEQINKHRSADLTKVHRFIFGKTGPHSEVKKHLRMFSGFAFAKSTDEYEKKKQALYKMEKMGRDVLCDCLGLSKSGTKEVIMERILEFMLNPSPELVKGKGAVSDKSKRKSPSASPAKKKSPAKAKSKDDTSQDDVSKEEQSDDDNEEPKSSKTKKKFAVKKTKSIEPLKDKPKEGRKRTSAQSKKRKMPEPDESSEEEQEKPKKRPKSTKISVATSSENESPPEASSLEVKKNGLKNVGKKLTTAKSKTSPALKAKEKPAPKVPSFKKKTNTKNLKKTKQAGKKKNAKKSFSQSDEEEENDDDGENDSSVEKFNLDEEELADESGELNDFKIRKIVKQILDESDLRQVSMKSVIEQVMAKFDLVNAEENKVRIKEIVNEFLDF